MAAPALGLRPPVSSKHRHIPTCPIRLAIDAGGKNGGEAQRLRGLLKAEAAAGKFSDFAAACRLPLAQKRPPEVRLLSTHPSSFRSV